LLNNDINTLPSRNKRVYNELINLYGEKLENAIT